MFAIQVAIIVFFRGASFIVLILFPRVPSMSPPLSNSPPPPSNSPYGTFTNRLEEISSPLCISLEEVSVSLKEGENNRGVKGMLQEVRRRCRLILMGARGEYTWKEKQKDEEELGIDMAAVENDGKVLLRNVTGSFKTGELIVLMGGSGSGKTTLLNTIAGRGEHTKVCKFIICFFCLITHINISRWLERFWLMEET